MALYSRITWVVALLVLAVSGQGFVLAAGTLPPNQINLSQSKGYSATPVAKYDDAGRLHVAWADNPGSDDTSTLHVLYSHSDNDGLTFAQHVQISGPVGQGVRAREIRIATSPGGIVAIAWWAVLPSTDGDGDATVFVTLSTNGGVSFAPAVETPLRFKDRIRADREGFANTTNLSVSVNSDGRIFLLFTAQDYFHGYNVYFARSTEGLSFTEPKKISDYSQTIPRATANTLAISPSGRIYALWTESNGDFIDEIKNIYYVESTNGGSTFSAPKPVGRAAGVVAFARFDGNNVLLLTQIQKKPNGLQSIKVFSSKDGGLTYAKGVRLGKADVYTHMHQNSIGLAPGGQVAVAWTENASSPRVADGVYVALSRDGGKVFDPAKVVLDGLFFEPPSIAVSPAGKVVLVYSTGAVNLVDREIMVASIEPN